MLERGDDLQEIVCPAVYFTSMLKSPNPVGLPNGDTFALQIVIKGDGDAEFDAVCEAAVHCQVARISAFEPGRTTPARHHIR